MDYFGLFYLGVFSLAWLFGIKEHLEFKEKWYLILMSIISGIIIIVSVVLTWPAEIPKIIKHSWKFVIVYLIISEIFITKYELSVLPKRLKEKDDLDLQMDATTIGFTLFIGILLLAPGLCYAYKVAFL
jgi:hypothetical protein